LTLVFFFFPSRTTATLIAFSSHPTTCGVSRTELAPTTRPGPQLHKTTSTSNWHLRLVPRASGSNLSSSYPSTVCSMSTSIIKPESKDVLPASTDASDSFPSVAETIDRMKNAIVSAAEAQMDVVRAENASLRQSAERDRALIDTLRKSAQDALAAQELAQTDAQAKLSAMVAMADAHTRQRSEWEASTRALQEKTQKESKALITERKAVAKERETVAKEREAVAKERELLTIQHLEVKKQKQALLQQRMDIAQQLQGMVRSVQPDPFPTTAAEISRRDTRPITRAVARSLTERDTGTSDKSVPRKRARTEGGTGMTTPTLNASIPRTANHIPGEPTPTSSVPARASNDSPVGVIFLPARCHPHRLSEVEQPIERLSRIDESDTFQCSSLGGWQKFSKVGQPIERLSRIDESDTFQCSSLGGWQKFSVVGKPIKRLSG
ncbi:hypothetical protein DFH07DRAFT_226615, partial [Mycena maculata]